MSTSIDYFDYIRISIASSERVLKWSYGEVTKPETINYRTLKPERDGLFCERIFGPSKDWECYCGKYKRVRHKGIICERCGVEVTDSKVRRHRLGHIKLAAPVSHIWFLKGIPSYLGLLLDMTLKDLEQIIYFNNYVVVDPGESPFRKFQLLSEEEYEDYILENEESGLKVGIGAEVVKELLSEIELNKLADDIRAELDSAGGSVQKRAKLIKRLRLVESLIESETEPTWFIMDVLPVTPPDLRPMVQLDGGRFATSDLNDLYRRVINRNNRLARLLEMGAPEIIVRNEKRMLQEAVDALIDNGRRGRTVVGPNSRPLKSLSNIIEGKQGRFRQNLLGKRVDYSGRSVIVVGPQLSLNQCGLPKEMAIELFKPFVVNKLIERGLVQNIKSAKKKIERSEPIVWDILEEVVDGHPVLLNRAPTLHRLGIQAFEPQLIEGKAIQLHPLVCTAFNADFDGDQMAVHVPLSFQAQLEARTLMLSAYNILSPANGQPLAIPTQDMVLGIYYLTRPLKNAFGSGKIYSSPEEVIIAIDHGKLSLQAEIKVRIDGKMYDTSAGRVILYGIVPEGIDFEQVNKVLGKKELGKLVDYIYKKLGNWYSVTFLDNLKDLGFKYSTIAGYSICIDDMIIPKEKNELIVEAYGKVQEIERHYREEAALSKGERYNQIIDVWSKTNEKITDKLIKTIENLGGDASKENKREKYYNTLYVMSDSGARGSKAQIAQLAGMRGLMAKPSGEIIETPIDSNFREGLTMSQYFISTHGARKGLADTALKTANSGYLTRRLVDVAQDLIISEDDCGTIKGIEVGPLFQGASVVESLGERIYGRYTLEDLFDTLTDELVVEADTFIDEEVIEKIEKAGIDKVMVRSALTCDSEFGICKKCYGLDLATRRMIEMGEAAGTIAAQSIGEPGTQLTMRTFHIGGIASAGGIESSMSSRMGGSVAFEGMKTLRNRKNEIVVLNRNGSIMIKDASGRILEKYTPGYGSVIRVEEGDTVTKGQLLFDWDPHVSVIMTEFAGTVAYGDLTEGETLKEEVDQTTNISQKVVVANSKEKRRPRISIKDADNKTVYRYELTPGTIISYNEGDEVYPGDIIAKIPREAQKTKDITVGLPRVAELFEARKPKDPAIIAEIDGIVKIENAVRGMKKLTIENENTGDKKVYSINTMRYINAHEGDYIRAGEALIDGNINPHDILAVLGEEALAKYLVDEIQIVYRKSGVSINDKHIEVIVRQMLKKVIIEDAGDSDFMPNEEVYKSEFKKVQQELLSEGKEPPKGRPILQGITKAALNTESFISAASFQETTRVLTDAACSGKTDKLRGLKENVIMGKLIPAGTGSKHIINGKFKFITQEN